MRYEIVQKVVADIEGAERCQANRTKGTVGQSVKQGWDCSQVKNEEEEEEEVWQMENQMELLWSEGERLEKILERRRMEGNSLQAEVMQGA